MGDGDLGVTVLYGLCFSPLYILPVYEYGGAN